MLHDLAVLGIQDVAVVRRDAHVPAEVGRVPRHERHLITNGRRTGIELRIHQLGIQIVVARGVQLFHVGNHGLIVGDGAFVQVVKAVGVGNLLIDWLAPGIGCQQEIGVLLFHEDAAIFKAAVGPLPVGRGDLLFIARARICPGPVHIGALLLFIAGAHHAGPDDAIGAIPHPVRLGVHIIVARELPEIAAIDVHHADAAAPFKETGVFLIGPEKGNPGPVGADHRLVVVVAGRLGEITDFRVFAIARCSRDSEGPTGRHGRRYPRDRSLTLHMHLNLFDQVLIPHCVNLPARQRRANTLVAFKDSVLNSDDI